ncbi:ChaN family lipoprotein [Candidatus Margulisiibacteriota bacterium]
MTRFLAGLKNIISGTKPSFRILTPAEQKAQNLRLSQCIKLKQEAITEVFPNMRPVDYRKLVTTYGPDVILFGEPHTSRKAGEEVQAALKVLKRFGFNALGFEVFSSENQPQLDAFAEGKRSGIFKTLQKRLSKNDKSVREQMFNKYASLLNACRIFKFKPVGLTLPDKIRNKLKKEEYEQAYEEHMASMIRRVLSRRLAAIMGTHHILPGHVPSMLDNETLTIAYAGGRNLYNFRERTFPGMEVVENIAREEYHMGDSRIMFMGLDRKNWGTDVIIHLSQMPDA